MFFAKVEKTPLQLAIEEALKAKDVVRLKNIFKDLKSINFNFNSLNIDGDDVELIAKALEDNTTVEQIDFMAVKIGDIGAKHVGDLLKLNKHIKSIIFLNCLIGPTGIKHLVAGIRENKYLESLSLLGKNPFGDVGMLHLCAALEGHSSLQGLGLCNDSFSKNGWINFGNVIGAMPKLEHLELRDHDFRDPETFKGALKGLSSCQTIRSLFIRNNEITAQSIDALAELFLSNTSLREVEIWCDNESFSLQALHKVLRALAHNKTLNNMVIWCNEKIVEDFKDEGFDFNGYHCKIEISSGDKDVIEYIPPNTQPPNEQVNSTEKTRAKLGNKK